MHFPAHYGRIRFQQWIRLLEYRRLFRSKTPVSHSPKYVLHSERHLERHLDAASVVCVRIVNDKTVERISDRSHFVKSTPQPSERAFITSASMFFVAVDQPLFPVVGNIQRIVFIEITRRERLVYCREELGAVRVSSSCSISASSLPKARAREWPLGSFSDLQHHFFNVGAVTATTSPLVAAGAAAAWQIRSTVRLKSGSEERSLFRPF